MTREEPAFKIKNGNFPLFVLHVHTTDMDKLKSELETRLTQTPDFFTNTPVVLALAAIADSGVTPDLADLATFMRTHGMWAAGVLGGSAEQRQAAMQAGLGLFPDAPSRRAPQAPQAETPQEPPLPPPTMQPELPGLDTTAVEDVPRKETAESGTETLPPAAMPAPQPTTMIVDKPVRTGQRIYARNANLVVLAIVNAGAELIADGDIHVYAPLRGKALAGAQGNENARIFARKLEAELVSIAGCFQVFENGVPENVRGKPTQVRLDGTRLILDPLPE